MIKKRMVFLLPAMRMGGAEKISINFLKSLVEEYDVTVALNVKEGELLDRLPENVRVVVDPLWSFNEVVKYDISHLAFLNLVKDFIYYIRVKLGKNQECAYRYLVRRSPWQLGHYDIAISYVANVSTQIFSLSDRVDADKKIAWIHGETNDLKDTFLFEEIYRTFNKIYCVSQVSKQHFDNRFISCCNITDVYYNPIDRHAILAGAEQPLDIQLSKNHFNIVSVGRLSPEKGFDMIPSILQILKNKGHYVKWYLIGDGTLQESIRSSAKLCSVEDRLVMLGTLTNPYPYMKACDLYVQPSYEEGYSTTICEAAILGKAIVGTTTSGGIREQIENDITGFIVDPVPDKIAELIAELVTDTEKLHKIEKTVKEKNFLHKDEIKKLISFLNA